MYEHKTMHADSFPSAEQLDDLARDGWEMFLLMPDGHRYVVYLRRLKQAA